MHILQGHIFLIKMWQVESQFFTIIKIRCKLCFKFVLERI